MAEHNFSKGIEMQNVFLRLKNKLEEAGILAASFELRQIFGAVTKKGVYYDIRLAVCKVCHFARDLAVGVGVHRIDGAEVAVSRTHEVESVLLCL